MALIYLDYNATTPLDRQVLQAMQPFLEGQYGNPSSDHDLGQTARRAVEQARKQVATLIGALPNEIVFTSGGTESNNMALWGVARAAGSASPGHLVISALEHPATVEPARYLESLGWQLTVAAARPDGVVTPDAIRSAIRPTTRLVSVMHANNEIGTIQPLTEIAQICRDQRIIFHTDAAQTVGKIATNVDALQVDLLSLAGHKFYAPKGIGALYLKSDTPIKRLLEGAGQEHNWRPGTENVAAIVGLGKAAELARENFQEAQGTLLQLRDRLLSWLETGLEQTLMVHGQESERLPNTLSVHFPQVQGSHLLKRIPELCASTGAACHAGARSISPTLTAIGLSAEQASGSIRLSLGRFTQQEDVDQAAAWLVAAWKKERRKPSG